MHEKIGMEKLSGLPKVTQQICGELGLNSGIWAFTLSSGMPGLWDEMTSQASPSSSVEREREEWCREVVGMIMLLAKFKKVNCGTRSS